MSILDIQYLMQSGILQVLKMCAPVLGFALVVGLVVAILRRQNISGESLNSFLPLQNNFRYSECLSILFPMRRFFSS